MHLCDGGVVLDKRVERRREIPRAKQKCVSRKQKSVSKKYNCG